MRVLICQSKKKGLGAGPAVTPKKKKKKKEKEDLSFFKEIVINKHHYQRRGVCPTQQPGKSNPQQLEQQFVLSSGCLLTDV
jgi:hypothetical protein